MKAHLVACSSCGRHVRVSEEACPFCSVKLSDALRASPAPRRIAARLSRAALFALGTASATAAGATSIEACDSNNTTSNDVYGGPPGDGGHSDAAQNAIYGAPADSGPLVDAAYGGPPFQDAQPLVDAAYGGPPIQDAGNDADADQ